MNGSLGSDLVKLLKSGTPLIGIYSADPADVVRTIVKVFQEAKRECVILWDCVRGGRLLSGKFTLGSLSEEIGSPAGILNKAIEFPPKTILIILGANSFLQEPMVVQSIWNLRDLYKKDGSALILIDCDIRLPSALKHDVIVIEHPYPGDDQLREKVISLDSKVASQRPDGKKLTEQEVDATVSLLRGMSLFEAEQCVATCLRKDGIDLEFLGKLRIRALEQVPGIVVDRGKLTFDHIGGLEAIKKFSVRRFSGPRPPRVIVRVEEIEKVMAGSMGDLSGVSQDALQVLLNNMQDNEWEGLIAFGPPGSGKSLYSQALANTFNCLSLSLDLGACKGTLVGESEQRIRQAMAVIKAIGGKDVFFVATCNRTDTLPAELQRRFNRGVWFFDLPGKEERESIWKIQMDRYGITGSKPKDEGWSGANIRDCCDLAFSIGCSLEEAAEYIVASGIRFKRVVEQSREEANGVYLDASRGGVYTTTQGINGDSRMFSL